ncbi:MAG: TolC family protein, partial [candidate division Zixibacteria bacterium]|nr:TolC family protein [candidate division Zixibacteria bacterium]
GQSSVEEVISSEINTTELSNRKIQFATNLNTALLKLGQLTNDSMIAAADIAASLPVDIDAHFSDASIAIVNNPGLARAGFRLKAAKDKKSLAKSKYMPNLMLGVDYRIRSNNLTEPIGGEDFLSFKIGFSLPLWFFAKQKNEVRSARQGILAAEAEQNSYDIMLKQSIKDRKQQIESLSEQANQYSELIIPLTESAFEAAFVAYEVGQIDFKALLADQVNLLNAKLAHLNLVRQFHRTKAVLDELTGREFGE